MLYDLGRMKVISDSMAWLLIFTVMLGATAIGCVVLSIAVRIGDLIIGW